MAIILDTSDDKARAALEGPPKFWTYCALDSAVTWEVHAQIKPQLREKPCLTADGIRYFEEEVYEFSRVMQAPVSDMMRSGLKVDDYARGDLISRLNAERTKLKGWLQRMMLEGLELDPEAYPFILDFNCNSIQPPTVNQPNGGHVQRLLYEILELPKVMGDTGKPSVDRDALEKLERYPSAKPFCMIFLALRDLKKNLEDLQFDLDKDGRIRTTFGVASTKTGRMSSYKATTGTGRNLQNVDPILRHIYCADKGRKYAYIDLEQAESRMVGAIVWSLFGEPAYLDACEADDLHTAVSAMTWDHIKTRDDAEQLFYRNFTYRFTSKRLGHGTSYYGKPPRLARETTIPIKLVVDFQEKFFTAFPGIRRWHHWTSEQLATQGFLVSLMGRKRWFMGRAEDDSTLREAIAYDPQNSIAELLNRGLFRLWHKSKIDPENFPIRCLLQVHDAVLLDYPEDADESVLLPRLMNTIITPITLRHNEERRTLIVPAAAQIGFNWGEIQYDRAGNVVGNPDGLIDFDTTKRDARRRINDPQRAWMDQSLR